jgi:threonine dehydrogenase-like Zn-dependent dehydrogenase
MPKKLMCIGKEQLRWQEYEDQQLGPGQVRVRAEFAAAKHGTEMSFYKGYGVERGSFDREYQLFRKGQQERSPYPAAVGNMLVGPIEELGRGVTRLSVGDRVCVFSGFAETRVANEGACWKLSEGMSWKSAVCLDPAEFAFAAVRDGQVRIGDAVAVFGLGAIGLLVVQLARLAGASLVIGIDPLVDRRKIAQDLGVDLTLDPRAVDAGLEIKKATDRRGADVVIEYSGSVHAMQQALRGVAYGGNVVMGAYPPPYPASLDLGAEAHLNIPNIIFSRACSQPDRDHPRWTEPRIFETCWRWLCDGRLTGDRIVQPVVAFEQLLQEYPKIASEPDRYIKLGVQF